MQPVASLPLVLDSSLPPAGGAPCGPSSRFAYVREQGTQKQKQCGVIPRWRIPGTIPGRYPEYPDQRRGGFLILVMIYARSADPQAREATAVIPLHRCGPGMARHNAMTPHTPDQILRLVAHLRMSCTCTAVRVSMEFFYCWHRQGW